MFDRAVHGTMLRRVALVAAVAFAGAVACSESGTDPSPGGNGGNGGDPAGGNGEEPDATVSVIDNSFDEASITIQVGETVRWTNNGTNSHTVTADPNQASNPDNVSLPEGAETFDSGFLSSGDSFEYTFEVAGTYDYICIPHEGQDMVGTVIVQE